MNPLRYSTLSRAGERRPSQRGPGFLLVAIGLAALASGAGCAAKAAETVEAKSAGAPAPPAKVAAPTEGGAVGSTPSVAPGESIPTPEELARANADLDAQLRSGWVRWEGAEGYFVGELAPKGSYKPTGGNEASNPLVDADRTPVYDAPNGTVVGFNYNSLGWVSLERSQGFDAAKARVEKNGCDPVLDEVCNQRLAQRAR